MEFGFLFIAAGAVVVVAGTALARFGEAIAQRTRMGQLWSGAVLLAGATSLPELGTDSSATRMGALDLHQPECARGGLSPRAQRVPVGRDLAQRFTMLEPDSALIVLTYVLAIWMLYLQRGGDEPCQQWHVGPT